MTDAEILAVFGGLIAGYWLVSKALSWNDKKKSPPASQPGAGTGAGTGAGEEQASSAVSRNSAWHVMLMVPKTAPLDEIKAAYKDLIRQYHPDKVANMGPELQELAERKSKEINAAYQAAMRERGGRG